MSDELKPCPFCGSTDIDAEFSLAQKPDGKKYHEPGCNKCGATCLNWNTRFTPRHDNAELVRELVEGLRNAYLNLILLGGNKNTPAKEIYERNRQIETAIQLGSQYLAALSDNAGRGEGERW